VSGKEIYQGLLDWLKKGGVTGLPETDELLPMIKASYTLEEASLLTGMPFSGKDLAELAEIKEMDPAVLGEQLDEMARKGLVFRVVKGDRIRYSLNEAFFVDFRSTWWGGATDDRAKAIAPLANQYYYHGGWDQWKETHIKYLRAVPVHRTIKDTREIRPYEDVVKVLDEHDYFSVSTCCCKHRKNLDPNFDDSKYPLEVCLHFGRLGRYIDENGMGRRITREEAGEILRKSAEAGLVHGVSNWAQAPDTICNCDPDSCMFFEAVHKLKHAKGMSASNYRVRNERDTCIGCGLCVKRCPMHALRLEDAPEARGRVTVVTTDHKGKAALKNRKGKVSAIDHDQCIGCGVCVYKCPSNSLALVRRDVLEDPPRNARELVQRAMTEMAAAGKQRESNGNLGWG